MCANNRYLLSWVQSVASWSIHETLSTTHHVNPSWCTILADLLVGTEQCLQTNKAIDKRNCSCGISGEVINGHPLAKQEVGTWWQRQSTRQSHDQRIWVGALTGGERAPAEAKEGLQQRGAEGGDQRWASQIFSPHQPSGHRRFCRTLWVTSTARLI